MKELLLAILLTIAITSLKSFKDEKQTYAYKTLSNIQYASLDLPTSTLQTKN